MKKMTKSLQEKIDTMKPFPTLTEKILRTDVNKAIQELLEEIDNLETLGGSNWWINKKQIIALIGEKK